MTRPAAMSERSWGLWVATWRGLGAALRPLPYYPLWEVELYGVLLEQIDDIAAIFRHYAAGPPAGEVTSGPPAGAPLTTGFEDIQLSKASPRLPEILPLTANPKPQPEPEREPEPEPEPEP